MIKINTITFTYVTMFISLILIIFIHELCHLLAGIMVGKKPKVLSIGFWRPYLSVKIKDIEFRLTPFILGGFVSFTEDFKKSTQEVKKLSTSKQILIYIAGCAGNVLTGILIFIICCLYLFKDLSTLFTTVYSLMYESIMFFYNIMAMLFTDQAIPLNLDTTIAIINNIININNLSVEIFLSSLLMFGVLSFVTGLTNLIPLPPIDGGHIAQAIIEFIIGRKFSHKVNVALTYFGFAVVILFTLATIYLGYIKL